MANIIITKWLEPYVLLETSKKYYSMKDFTFDGSNKIELKEQFLKELQTNPGKTFGLYMKNVNKFYIFSSSTEIDLSSFVSEFASDSLDLIMTNSYDEPFEMIDMGKAEASFIKY